MNRSSRSSLVLESAILLVLVYLVVLTLVLDHDAAVDANRLRAIEHHIGTGQPFDVHNDCGSDLECRTMHPGACPPDQPYCF